MPTYEYKCKKCGHEFELFQKMSDPAVKDCPKCNAKGAVVKIIGSGSGIIFKGSGFYANDYKKAGKNGNGSCRNCPAKDSTCPKDNK
ncbi:MAG: hypothetical protein JW728_05060 [Candidatus Aureabacteria bacterium]|nr:hypothetical protein [Candidatus Auribacterota bacterium]